jgi:predicted ribosome quality control (RQC) complex YloA/Tae2 family protein
VNHPKSAKGVDEKAIWERERLKVLSKKRKAMQSIEASMIRLTPEAWAEVGEYLKTYGNKQIPEKFLPFVRLEQSLSWNIENCFQESKAAEAKMEGARERQNLLAKEIEALEQEQFQARPKKNQIKKPQELQLTDVKARTLRLESGLIAYLGKSAQDNLRILRSAKSWDLWLHLRDYPGAHAIIRKNKAQVVSLNDLEKVSRWLAEESLGRDRAHRMGFTEIVYTEVRFVRPIKGDRLGRVNYQNGQTLNVALQSKV